MARLFTCGYEESTTVADGVNLMWSYLANTPQIAANPHSGSYALKCSDAGRGAWGRLLHTTYGEGKTLYLRCYFYLETAPAGDCQILDVSSNTAAYCFVLYITSARKLKVTDAITSTSATSTNALSLGAWYRIEVRLQISDTTGQIEVRFYEDGDTAAVETFGIGNFAGGDGTDRDTLPTNIGRVYFGNRGSDQNEVLYLDDVAINNTDDPGDGSNLSWCGPGKIALIYPDTDTATVQWSPNTGTDHADLVDDVPGTPDDATTYNGDTQATNIDRLNATTLPAEVTSDATIKLVDVYARVGNDSTTGTPSMLLYLWDEAGTLTPGPALSTDINGWRICATNEHLVYNAAGKTKANVGNFDFGYKGNTADGKNKWITALWANVEWIEAAGGGATEITPTVGAATLSGVAPHMDLGLVIPTQVDP